MSNEHNGTVFRVLYPKISTGQEKLAPTGRHGRHVFATLPPLPPLFPRVVFKAMVLSLPCLCSLSLLNEHQDALMMVASDCARLFTTMKSLPQRTDRREICRQTGTGGAASNNPNVIHMIPNPKVTSPNQADLGETPAHAFLRRLETGCWRGWRFLPYVS